VPESAPERVIAYIDGFNLYFGIKDAFPKRYRWLDVGASAARMLRHGQVLTGVNYFSARIAGPREKQLRQESYLQALETTGRCVLHFGSYRNRTRNCWHCGTTFTIPEEKMTDVKIAVQMLSDALQDQFDTALLISGDTDLVPPVLAVRNLFPAKRVIVAFPPRRANNELADAASAHFRVYRNKLVQLPDRVTRPDGFVISRPNRWA
jgi:hypothetical protein